MTYHAKTDWQLNDTVYPDDMNRIERGLKDAYHVIEQEQTVAKEHANIVTKVIKDIRVNLIELKIQYETDKKAEATGVNASLFTETFINLNDITLLNGATKHDSVNMEVYLA